MNIDTRLEEKLGFDRIRKAISDRCCTEYAADRVASEHFSSDEGTIKHRLLLTDEMRLIVMFEENFPTTGYIDAHPFLKPLLKDGYSIDVLSIAKLKTMLETSRKITSFFGNIKDGIYPNLKKMASPVVGFPDVQKRIDTIIDKYGDIKDTASDELYSIRRNIRDKEAALSKRASAILRKAQEEGIVESDASVAVRDGKFLIPVSSANKRKFSGFVYDESATGKTSYIEPTEIIELENDISELHFAETREIARILYEFSEFLRPYVPDLIDAATFLGEIDFLMAKAQTALDYIAGMPIISQNGELILRKARHPLLEHALKKEAKQIVPISLTLNPTKHILLISGPNAGGKSVCLKTTGLLQYMFQWGMLIPTSETSEMPVFDRIIVSIGDDQSIDNDLSTYSSFLVDMRTMLDKANEKTLVLIDEFGSGTEPAAGGAIAEAILSELDSRGVYGVITTHYTNLKLYAAAGENGVINGAMLFDAKNIAPLFQLEIGLPGNSFAFELARKMGLPENIIKDAESRAGEEFVGIERNLKQIAKNRRALDQKLQKVKVADKTLENITGKYQKELEDIKQKRKDILDEAHKQAEEIVRGANKTVENTIRTIKEAQAEKEQTKEARKELQGFLGALERRKNEQQKAREEYIEGKLEQLNKRKEREKARRARRGKGGVDTEQEKQEEEARRLDAFRSAPLKVGEKVRVKENGMVGEVSKVSNKAVTLIIGSISSKMPLDRVERISSNEYKAAVKKTAKPVATQSEDESIRSRKLNFRSELDIRGERLSDALDIVTHYIDDAMMLGMGSVRIIHGKGTGVLREEIQKYLRTIPGVSCHDEHIQFGGSGVTIVDFE